MSGQVDDQEVLDAIAMDLVQSLTDFIAVVTQVNNHLKRIVSARSALGALRSRLIGMRERVKQWDSTLWDMGWREGISIEDRRDLEREIHEHHRALEDMIWRLFDYRGLENAGTPEISPGKSDAASGVNT